MALSGPQPTALLPAQFQWEELVRKPPVTLTVISLLVPFRGRRLPHRITPPFPFPVLRFHLQCLRLESGPRRPTVPFVAL